MGTAGNQRRQNGEAGRSEWRACVCRFLHNHHFFHPVPEKGNENKTRGQSASGDSERSGIPSDPEMKN